MLLFLLWLAQCMVEALLAKELPAKEVHAQKLPAQEVHAQDVHAERLSTNMISITGGDTEVVSTEECTILLLERRIIVE